MEVKPLDIVLCEFYFSDFNTTKNRPVLVFKDNLPYDDFIGIPISSNTDKLFDDECLIDDFDFKNGGIPKNSKIMIRKTFVVSKQIVIKKYGTLSKKSYMKYHSLFCKYFGCEK